MGSIDNRIFILFELDRSETNTWQTRFNLGTFSLRRYIHPCSVVIYLYAYLSLLSIDKSTTPQFLSKLWSIGEAPCL